MKSVYILTEEGREYSDEGCRYITNMLMEGCGETDQLVFNMGAVYNDPEFLDRELEQNPDCYVVISAWEGIMAIYGDSIKELRKALYDFPGQTSWKTANMIWQEESTEQ